ncbi:hypothetical protein [Actinacidiphila sp. bgisy160]|uniref:hypothetical protein n=1 Tax=Actinacidiphila sp. bgisy160 TaxID=3413796 RepID=UPI003D756D1E
MAYSDEAGDGTPRPGLVAYVLPQRPRAAATAPVAHRGRPPLALLLCTVALTAATALAALLRSLLPPGTATGPFARDVGSPR